MQEIHDETKEAAAIAARIAAWSRGETPGPYALELYPTLRCNLECRYCDTTLRHTRPDPARELTPAEVARLVDEAAALGVRRLSVLGGGEPLEAAEATFAALERAKAHGLHGVLRTNATLLGQERAARLVALGWDEVHVSLDGPDAASNDALRDNSFRRAATAVAALAAARETAGARRPRIVIHCVVTRRNLDTLPALIRFAAENGVARVNFDHVVPYTAEMTGLQVGSADHAQLAAQVAAARAEAERRGVAEDLETLLHAGAADRGRRDAGPLRLDERSLWGGAPCYFPWFYLSIRSDGSVGPCCVASGPLPTVVGRPLAEVWHGAHLTHLRQRMRLGVTAPYCSECSAALRRHTEAIRAALDDRTPLDARALAHGLREELSLAEAGRVAERKRAEHLRDERNALAPRERQLRAELTELHRRHGEELAAVKRERFSLRRALEDRIRELADLERRLDFLTTERDALNAELRRTVLRLQTILASRSWRALRFLGIVRDV